MKRFLSWLPQRNRIERPCFRNQLPNESRTKRRDHSVSCLCSRRLVSRVFPTRKDLLVSSNTRQTTNSGFKIRNLVFNPILVFPSSPILHQPWETRSCACGSRYSLQVCGLRRRPCTTWPRRPFSKRSIDDHSHQTCPSDRVGLSDTWQLGIVTIHR